MTSAIADLVDSVSIQLFWLISVKQQSPMTEENKPQNQNWWQTLPGILTAMAAILTALTGLIAGLYEVGFFP
ncbi:MAG: hypothetical protein F6K28_50310, partial [Microcoleus sp. SIO2G3]|nr:hypothetical protein [Microcoleus sp. SIO2G3]